MQSDELKRRISAGRGDALADLVLKNAKTQTEYIRHHRCSAAESRSGCFLIGDNKILPEIDPNEPSPGHLQKYILCWWQR